jgi:hypothetical protein
MTFFGLIGTIRDPITGSLHGGISKSTVLLSAIIRAITLAAGIWALINFVLAGTSYITSGGNPEKIQHAWARIYQSIIGLSIVVLSFAFAGALGQILFGSPTAILQPTLQGP